MDSSIKVTIYQPRKSAMTQGMFNLGKWKIRFQTFDDKYSYDLMNWTGAENMHSELDLEFDTKEDAISFVNKKHWKFNIEEIHEKLVLKKSYADNFK
jgi:hypothetical protein